MNYEVNNPFTDEDYTKVFEVDGFKYKLVGLTLDSKFAIVQKLDNKSHYYWSISKVKELLGE